MSKSVSARNLRRGMLLGVSLMVSAPALAAPVGWHTPPSQAAVAAAAAAQQAAAQAAQGAAYQATQSLSAAARALQAAAQAQNVAHSLFLLKMPNNLGTALKPLPAVTNGLQAGGLVPIDNDPTFWQGANSPSQTTDSGHVTVTVQQTSAAAALNWSSFNVGANTTVDFVQQSSTWSVLNRVLDLSGNPSQILGQIKALGTVLLINANGIIFGGGSQVNVHSLIASALDVGDFSMTRLQRDQNFINLGIAASLKDFERNSAGEFFFDAVAEQHRGRWQRNRSGGRANHDNHRRH